MGRIKKFLLNNTSTRQTVVKNTFWVGSSTTVIKIIRSLVIIYAARLLGTQEYGIFTYAMSIAAMFALFSDMGLTSILTRELSKHTEKKSNYLATAFGIKTGFIFITMGLVVIFGPLVSQFAAAKPLLILVALSIVMENFRGFLYATTRAENKMEIEAGIGIAAEIICTITVVTLFIMKPTAFSLALGYAIGNTIGFFITFLYLKKYINNIFSFFDQKLILPILRSALPFTIMGVFGIFMANMDSYIIGFFLDPSSVGLYAAAQKPISLLYILPGFLSIGLFPLVSKLVGEKNHQAISTIIKKTSLVSIAIALPLVVGGIILAQPIITVTYGYSYIGAVVAFQILIVTLLMAFPGGIFSDVILAEDKQKLFIKSSIVGALINVALDLVLIPKFGIAGSAATTLLAHIVMNGIIFYEVIQIYRIKFSVRKLLEKTIKLLLALVGMGGIVWIMQSVQLPLLLIIPTGGIVYLGILYILKEKILHDIILPFKAKNI